MEGSIPTPEARRVPGDGRDGAVRPRAAGRWLTPGRLADVAAALLLFVLVAFFFWRLWAPNPADRVAFPVGDFTDQYYPLRRFVAASLSSGHLPFWNPYIYAGQPGLADPQAATFYPPAVVNALLWGARYSLLALELEVVAHILIAAWGAYLFARAAAGLGVLPALVTAVTFAFSGYLTGFPLEQVTILEAAAWLPWLLLALHRASAHGDLRARVGWAAVAAIIYAFAILAGHPQTALYLTYLGAAYALFRVLVASPLGGGTGRWRRLLPGALIVLVVFPLGAGLAALQLLPTRGFIEESSRSALDYAFAQPGLRWEELLTVALPKLAGSSPLYLGVVTLLLAPAGLLGRARRPETWFWAAAAVASLLIAPGGNSFFFDLLYLVLPGLGEVRSQERVLLVFCWSVALLAGWGLAALLETGRRARGRARLRRYVRRAGAFLPVLLLPLIALWWLRALIISQFSADVAVFDAFYGRYSFFFFVFLLAWALFAWYTWRPASRAPQQLLPGVLLLALLTFDLFTINREVHIGGPVGRALTARTPVVEAAQTWHAVAPARVAVVGDPPVKANDGMRWELPLLSGNEPLRLENTNDFLDKIEPWRQFQLLNVRYVIAGRDLAAESPEIYESLAEGGGAYLVRVRRPMPYAWIVGQTEILPGGRSEIRVRLNDAAFDPMAAALFDEPQAAAEKKVQSSVTVEERRPGYVRMRARSDAAAILIVAEPFTKGWQATIDGRPVEVIRANLINAAVTLPPGEHEVVLRYEPRGWRNGLILSGASLLLLLAMLAWGFSGRRSQRI